MAAARRRTAPRTACHTVIGAAAGRALAVGHHCPVGDHPQFRAIHAHAARLRPGSPGWRKNPARPGAGHARRASRFVLRSGLQATCPVLVVGAGTLALGRPGPQTGGTGQVFPPVRCAARSATVI
jgi:hypothetical protein